MIKQIDIQKAKNRRAIWDYFDWGYLGNGINYLRNNHSLNCGCGMCKGRTFERRLNNKRERISSRLDLKLGEYDDT